MARHGKHGIIGNYLLWILVLVGSAYLAGSHIIKGAYPFSWVKGWVLAGAGIGLIGFTLFLGWSWKKTEIVFLIAYLLFGSFYFIALPLFKVPDEMSHFLRAYEISCGHMLSDISKDNLGGRELPYNLSPENLGLSQTEMTHFDIWERYGRERLSEETSFLIFWNTSLYAPISYFPQAIGIGIARLLTDRIAWIAYAGRIAGFLFVGLIGFLAVKYVPFGKKAMLLVLLLPINMQEAVSLAPDSMVTALTCALISFVLYMRETRKKRMEYWHYILLYCLCILIGLYKIVYLPFCLFPFLIPKERFGGKRNYMIHAVVLGILVTASSMGWLLIAGRYLSTRWGADGREQVHFILTQPFEYLRVLGNTWKVEGANYLYNIIGKDFGWLTIRVPKEFVWAYAVLCLLILLLSGERSPEKFYSVRLVSFIVVICVFLLTFTSIYVQWNLPRAEIIQGIQGRYFVPLVFPVCMLVHGIVPSLKKVASFSACLFILVFGIQICMLSDIFAAGIGEYGGGFREDINGKKYQVSETEYVTDRWYQSEGLWYYFDKDGYLLRNVWIEGAEGYYYVAEEGYMLTDTITPDGYRVDEKGRRIGKWTK